jgi:hypothetical protein
MPASRSASQFSSQCAGVLGAVKRAVADVESFAFQPVAEVAHRREEQRDMRLVAPDARGFFGGLSHPNHIARRVEIVESG